ncbi:MAG TPA: hypothetical protein VJT85_04540 [Gemmatimonadaceae bacterium]|nr:hypothetical protein [Gemmatimonadaceae bacterium]
MRRPNEPRFPDDDEFLGDARHYVPDELLVRATVGASACLTAVLPRDAAERLHLSGCEDCQQRVEDAFVERRSPAAAYLASERIIHRVITRSRIRRFRLPPSLQTVGDARPRLSVTKAAASVIAASGLVPSVLAAAVLLHAAALAAAGAWLGASLRVDVSLARAVSPRERVTYVALPGYSRTPGTVEESELARFRAGVTQELGDAIRQAIPVAANSAAIAPADAARLSETARLLARLAPVRVRIESDSSTSARARASSVADFLRRRGVRAQQLSIESGAQVAGVRVVLDTVGDLRP